MMIQGIFTFGFSGYLFLLFAASGAFLLLIESKASGSDRKSYRLSKRFGWIHLMLSLVVVMMLWLR
ncbi:CLC_0170 family protein [Paenibacillus soyae]|uniref:Uncharacterized protein n=1 Tax=Paenibacillus soyae TaxID=2969249 RepID=A0A9X2MUF0_9BACL|nr:CLC_0170 family protein [Paenibacillus soyae]MCR2807206.1 hypothetical protein [Paenibacillus soyae]